MKIKTNVATSDSGFVFNPSTGESYSLNPIATEILGLAKAGNSKKEIVDTVLSKYHVDAATFEKDFADFEGMLNHFRLIDNET
jgi:hypothetical protein